MSSGVRTTHTPNFSFQRSSTPIPYSLGKPALNCCGGSLSTLGNMNRPVAASAATEAAEDAPHESAIHARRVNSGDVSSGSRVEAAATAAAGTFAAAPPGEAGVVVRPARAGRRAGEGRGATAGRAAAGVAAAGRAAGVVVECGVAAGF